jgi:hypothetical protein
LAHATQRAGGGPAAQVAGRLEKIHEALEQIRDLVSEFEHFRKPPPDRDD